MSEQVDALLPRRWLAYSLVTGRPSADPELSDTALAEATDAQIANALNLYGWPVLPNWRDDSPGPWTGGTHWP